MKRIRILSVAAMVLMAPMLIAYPYEALSWQLELSFLDWGKWTRNDAWVDPDVNIPLTTRIVFFAVWFIPTVFGMLAYLIGFHTLMLVWRGVIFDARIARNVTWMGGLIVVSSGGALLAGAVSPMIRSWHNDDGPLPLRFWYDSGNLGMLYAGMAFVFLGLVMAQAKRIADENEDFV